MPLRIRISFSKTSAMRFTSHLDLHKSWERTFRRAGLPLTYNQGYNPRPRLQLACALPLGFTSDCELLDAWLNDEALTETDIRRNLERALPPGLKIHFLMRIDLQAPPLQTRVRSASYSVTLLEHVPDLEARLANLLAAGSLPRQRRGKPYDLRPLIETCQLSESDDEGHPRIFIQLAAQEGHTGRPEEVIEAIGVSPLAARIHRSQLLLDIENMPVIQG